MIGHIMKEERESRAERWLERLSTFRLDGCALFLLGPLPLGWWVQPSFAALAILILVMMHVYVARPRTERDGAKSLDRDMWRSTLPDSRTCPPSTSADRRPNVALLQTRALLNARCARNRLCALAAELGR